MLILNKYFIAKIINIFFYIVNIYIYMNASRTINNTCGGKRKTQKRRRTSQKSRKTRGGSCECDKTHGGARRKVRGGSAFLNDLPIRYLYQYKNEVINPQDPHTMVSGRLMGNPIKPTLGGKSKKRLNRLKRVRGGASDLLLGNSTSMNPITSFWTSAGLPNPMGTLSASPYVNESISVQPIEKNYGSHNPPLV
jgi:hypothetical protein